MSTKNPFDLLDGNDNEDTDQLIAAAKQKFEKLLKPPQSQQHVAAAAAAAAAPEPQPTKPAKLPTKPPPPSEVVRQAREELGRGRGRGSGRVFGFVRGRGERLVRDMNQYNNETVHITNNEASEGQKTLEEGDNERSNERANGGAPRGAFRGGRRVGFVSWEAGEVERPRRFYDRRSGTGRGNEMKRQGAGRGNWGTTSEIVSEHEEPVPAVENQNTGMEKQSTEGDVVAVKQEDILEKSEEEPENKEMTLEEYEKILEEKRKCLTRPKTEERKVDVDKEFEAMRLLSSKKENDEIFVKLGCDKDKRKDSFDKEEKSRKFVSINEFLKPSDGRRGYVGGRGRGRGRVSRATDSSVAAYGLESVIAQHAAVAAAPLIEDHVQFPSLSAR